MGCTVSQDISPNSMSVQNREGNEVEKMLAESKEEAKFNFKILLLGAGESGKSTVVKQIKIIWNVQPTQLEIRQCVEALQRNCVEAMQTLLTASKSLDIPLQDPNLEEMAGKIMALDQNQRSTPELAEMIETLWKDEGVQRTFARRNDFWHMDGTAYYLDEVFRISAFDFSPNDDDMIWARIRTTGIVVSEVVEKPYHFQIVDVGGQRSERRKWIHCFDDVKAVIYLASLSGYNQVLFEDSSENIMHESLKLFEDVAKNPIFKNTPFFIFLNKKDLFEEYIKTYPLKKCFPEYDGPEGEMNPALEYVQKQFRDVMEKCVPGKQVPISIIAARIRRDMKMAFGEVKDTLKKQYAKENVGGSHLMGGTSRKMNSIASPSKVHKTN